MAFQDTNNVTYATNSEEYLQYITIPYSENQDVANSVSADTPTIQYIIDDEQLSSMHNPNGSTVFMHNGMEYIIAEGNVDSNMENANESVQYLIQDDDDDCEEVDADNMQGNYRFQCSEEESEYLNASQFKLEKEHSFHEDESFEEIEYLDTDIFDISPEEIIDNKNEVPVGINKLTGQTISLKEFDKSNNFKEGKDGRIKLCTYPDGKNLFGRIVKFEKPSAIEKSSMNLLTVDSEKEQRSNMQNNDVMKNTTSPYLFDELSIVYSDPTKDETDNITRTLLGLMKMDTIEKLLGQRNLMIKYVIKTAVRGKVSPQKVVKLFCAQMRQLYEYDSTHNINSTYKLVFKNKTLDIPEVKQEMFESEQDEVGAPMVVVVLIVNVNENGIKKTKVFLPQKEGPVQCNLCDKIFKSETMRKRHMTVHTRYNSYPCDLCGQTFADRALLTRHRRIHMGEKKHKCKQCPKSFNTAGSLKRHVTIHNPLMRPLQCMECLQRFTDASSLKKHEKIHAGIRDFQCDICSREFVHIGDLNFHRKIHDEYKPYQCKICNREFSRHANLQRHLEIHPTVYASQVFPCDMCDCTYNFASSLTRHIVTAHFMSLKESIK